MVVMASKKWKKHQLKFERKAHEWLKDYDSCIPIANFYSFLVEESSDETRFIHIVILVFVSIIEGPGHS